MDSRAQFEAWMKKTGQNPPYAIKRGLWEVWKASRASVEVELPEKISPYNKDAAGFVAIAAVGYDEAIDDCCDALAIVGLNYRFGAKPADEPPLQHEAKEE